MFEFSPQEIAAIWLSLKIASIAVIFSLPFAIAVAWLLSRKEFWGKNLLNGIVHLPLVLPPVVIGYLLLISMAKRGVIGQFLWEWFNFSFSFSWKGAVLASMVMAFPLMVRSIRLALDAVDSGKNARCEPIKGLFYANFTTFIFWHYCRCGSWFRSLFR